MHKSDYLFKFDIKIGYRHIDIFPGDHKFLGFSWTLDGVEKYFVFTVLAFVLTIGPYIFTKLMRPLVAYWRFLTIKICVYLDDGLGAAQPLSTAIQQAGTVERTYFICYETVGVR